MRWSVLEPGPTDFASASCGAGRSAVSPDDIVSGIHAAIAVTIGGGIDCGTVGLDPYRAVGRIHDAIEVIVPCRRFNTETVTITASLLVMLFCSCTFAQSPEETGTSSKSFAVCVLHASHDHGQIVDGVYDHHSRAEHAAEGGEVLGIESSFDVEKSLACSTEQILRIRKRSRTCC